MYDVEMIQMLNLIHAENQYIFESQTEYCEWIKYDYRTLCPREHDINNPYWRMPVDRTKLAYCPYCGKKIKIVD